MTLEDTIEQVLSKIEKIDDYDQYVEILTQSFRPIVAKEYPKTDAAISIYALRAGEGLWEVAKRLHREPAELKRCNPELAFPVKAGERIFVYRQIK